MFNILVNGIYFNLCFIIFNFEFIFYIFIFLFKYVLLIVILLLVKYYLLIKSFISNESLIFKKFIQLHNE